MGFAEGAAGSLDGLWLGSFGSRRHGWIPVKDAAATVAGEQLALAELVPGLGADAHAAAGTLLIFGASQAGATGGGQAVKAGEPFGMGIIEHEEHPDAVTFAFFLYKLAVELLLAEGDAVAGFLEGGGEGLDLGARLGKDGFLRFSAFETREFFVFEAVGLS